MARPSGLDTNADDEVGFARPGWRKQHQVLGLGEEHTGAKVRDQGLISGRLMVEVEILQSFTAGTSGGLDPQTCLGRFALLYQLGSTAAGNFLAGPAFVARLVAQAPERITDTCCPQPAGVITGLGRWPRSRHDVAAAGAKAASISTANSSS
jgi:hypothetical protein